MTWETKFKRALERVLNEGRGAKAYNKIFESLDPTELERFKQSAEVWLQTGDRGNQKQRRTKQTSIKYALNDIENERWIRAHPDEAETIEAFGAEYVAEVLQAYRAIDCEPS
jgi:hypothetical protein